MAGDPRRVAAAVVTESRLRNVVGFFRKNKTMDNVQTQENFIQNLFRIERQR
jgi:hypothetical protein